MQRSEWEAFRDAVNAYQQNKNTPALNIKDVHRSVYRDDKEKLARRGYRTYEEQDERKKEQDRFGFVVRMRVDSINNIWENGPHTKWDPRKEDEATFLQIRMEPVDDFFLPLAKSGSYTPDSGEYHISLCYTSDLHRFDLYNFNNGLQKGKNAYDEVIKRYDGKIAHIRGRVRTGSVLIGKDTRVYIVDDPSDTGRRVRRKQQQQNPEGHNIYDDEQIKALLAAGKYARDDMHVTL